MSTLYDEENNPAIAKVLCHVGGTDTGVAKRCLSQLGWVSTVYTGLDVEQAFDIAKNGQTRNREN